MMWLEAAGLWTTWWAWLAAAGLAWFLLDPLLRSGGQESEAPGQPSRREQASFHQQEQDRERLLRLLSELEYDYQMDKVASEVYQRQKKELSQRLLALDDRS